MINLIPNEEKKKKARIFYFRLTILSLFMLSMSMGFAILSILPSYILVKAKDNSVNEKLKIQKDEPVPVLDQAALSTIQGLDYKLTLVETGRADKFIVSEKIINEIIKSKVFGIKVTGLNYKNDSASGKKIGINGTAPSRERLLLFRRALEGNSSFKNVDLPISNFVKGSDIEFYLTLTPS